MAHRHFCIVPTSCPSMVRSIGHGASGIILNKGVGEGRGRDLGKGIPTATAPSWYPVSQKVRISILVRKGLGENTPIEKKLT